MKYIVIVSIVILVGVVMWLIVIKTEPQAPKVVNQNAVVVAFGDSLVAGQGSGKDENFVSLLSQRLGIPIINEGVGGETTAGGLRRLEEDVLSKKPDVVIVLLGGNDALRRVPEEETFTNLGLIIDKIQQSGSKVLLLGIRGGFLGDAFKNRFEKLAKDKNVEYVSDVLSGLFSDSRYMADSIHPNAAGYKRIADRVEPVLRDMLVIEQ